MCLFYIAALCWVLCLQQWWFPPCCCCRRTATALNRASPPCWWPQAALTTFLPSRGSPHAWAWPSQQVCVCVCVFACVERRRTTKSAEFTVVFYLNIISRGGAQSSVYCSEGQHEVNNFYLQLVMITAGGVNVLFMLGENSKGCTFASVSWLQLTKIYRLSWAIY